MSKVLIYFFPFQKEMCLLGWVCDDSFFKCWNKVSRIYFIPFIAYSVSCRQISSDKFPNELAIEGRGRIHLLDSEIMGYFTSTLSHVIYYSETHFTFSYT